MLLHQRATVTQREVIRCAQCKLVQFKGSRTKCPRCFSVLTAKPAMRVVVALRPAPAPCVPWTLGQRVRAIRTRCGASQRDIVARMKCQRTYLSKIENDRVPNPNWRQITRLALALGCREADLFPPLKPMHAEETEMSAFMAALYAHCGMLTTEQWVAVRTRAHALWKAGGDRIVIVNSAEEEAS